MKTLLLTILLTVVYNYLFALNSFSDTSSIYFEKLDSEHNEKIEFSAGYIADIAGNAMGGKSTGAVFLGLANIDLSLNLESFGLWRGGEIFIHGIATHGQSPSEKLTGDFQVVSNIDAGGDFIFLQEFWYKQNFRKHTLTVGLQDLNANFVKCKASSLFINSSFGIAPVISDNVPSSIFPLTTLGITGKLQLSESFDFLIAAFDGNPTSFSENKYNASWKIKKEDGALLFGEIAYHKSQINRKTCYKGGFYYHTGYSELDIQTKQLNTVFDKNYGFYILTNTEYSLKSGKFIGVFSQLAYSPPSINAHNLYLGLGVNIKGLFQHMPETEIGMAASFADIKNNLHDGPEKTIELYVNIPLLKNFFIQPDIQYIINPNGTDMKLNNALICFLRFGFSV